MAGNRTLKLSILADVDNLKKSLNSGSDDVSSFGDKITKFGKIAGAAFLAAGAAAAAYAGKLLVDGVKSAIEDEAAQAKLATTLKNVTNATDNQIKAVEQQILKTALLTGKTDDELRPSFDRLLRSTKDVTEAQKLQSLALDISAGTGKSLSAVSEALGKAYDGNLGALKRLGVGIDDSIIKSKDFDAAAVVLAETFGGQASEQADTFQGKMARLTVAFDEAKETVGSYVLDALTPLISGVVDKVIPAIQDFASNLGKTLGPAFGNIFKIIKDDVLPIIKAWYEFIVDIIIPAITAIVRPVFEGLVSAFNTIKKAVSDNSEELKPLLGFFKSIAVFVRDNLAPILGGAFKLALQTIGSIVGGLVTGFSKLVGFISNTVTKIKEFVNFIKDNPVTRFFFGSDNSKNLSANMSYMQTGFDEMSLGSNIDPMSPGATRSTLPPELAALSSMQWDELFNWAQRNGFNSWEGRDERIGIPFAEHIEVMSRALVAFNAQRAQMNTPASPVITVNMGVVGDPESAARTIIQILNDSSYRGTGGAGAFSY